MSGEAPVLVYDDDCGICTRSALWLAKHGPIDLVGFSDLEADDVQRLPDDWERCAHLLVGDVVHSCGAAMEEAFRLTDHRATRLVRVLRPIPGYRRIREFGYRLFGEYRGPIGGLVGN